MTVILEPTVPTTGPTTDPRVLRGAELLDRERPGWWREINLDTLNLADNCACVIGQLDGDYYESCKAREWDGHCAERFGFTVLWATRGGAWRDLTRAWADLIYARRREEAV